MFGFAFYSIVAAVMLFCALPVAISGILFCALDEPPRKSGKKLSPIERIAAGYKKHANNKEELHKLLADFKTTLLTCPAEQKDAWLELVSEFSANMLLMEVEEVSNFRTELENANADIKKQIDEVVARALQKRQGK